MNPEQNQSGTSINSCSGKVSPGASSQGVPPASASRFIRTIRRDIRKESEMGDSEALPKRRPLKSPPPKNRVGMGRIVTVAGPEYETAALDGLYHTFNTRRQVAHAYAQTDVTAHKGIPIEKLNKIEQYYTELKSREEKKHEELNKSMQEKLNSIRLLRTEVDWLKQDNQRLDLLSQKIKSTEYQTKKKLDQIISEKLHLDHEDAAKFTPEIYAGYYTVRTEEDAEEMLKKVCKSLSVLEVFKKLSIIKLQKLSHQANKLRNKKQKQQQLQQLSQMGLSPISSDSSIQMKKKKQTQRDGSRIPVRNQTASMSQTNTAASGETGNATPTTDINGNLNDSFDDPEGVSTQQILNSSNIPEQRVNQRRPLRSILRNHNEALPDYRPIPIESGQDYLPIRAEDLEGGYDQSEAAQRYYYNILADASSFM